MVKNITKISILELYLSDYSRKCYLGEIASLLKKPHQTVKPYAEGLVKDNILIKTERKNLVEYGLNFRDGRIYDFLVIAEKEKTMRTIRDDMLIKTLFERLSPYFSQAKFIIFGSAAISPAKASDIDLLVMGSADVKKTLEDFEGIYGKKVHRIQVKDIKSLSEEMIIEIYKKHLILNNTEEIIRFFGGLYGKNRLV